MSMRDPLNHLGSIWYQSEPLELKKLVWTFFAIFVNRQSQIQESALATQGTKKSNIICSQKLAIQALVRPCYVILLYFVYTFCQSPRDAANYLQSFAAV